MKKKLLIIIILVVVLAIAGVLAFLIFTGRLFGGKGDGSSSLASSSLSASAASSEAASAPSSGAASSIPDSTASGSMAASVSPSGPAMAPTAQNDASKFFEGLFYFQNLTGSPLTEICLAPAGTNAWEDNLLGDSSLNNGEIWEQSLMLRDVGGSWDLRATDANGKELLYTGLDFYSNTKFLLTLEGEAASLRQAA